MCIRYSPLTYNPAPDGLSMMSEVTRLASPMLEQSVEEDWLFVPIM